MDSPNPNLTRFVSVKTLSWSETLKRMASVTVHIRKLKSLMENVENLNIVYLRHSLCKGLELINSLNSSSKISKNSISSNLAKFSRLCLAILDQDASQVAQLLAAGDYADYARILEGDEQHRPAALAFSFGGSAVNHAFVRARIELGLLYWKAVHEGNLELLERCTTSPDFDPCLQNSKGENALHAACHANQLEVIKVLVNRYGLSFDIRDSQKCTPLFFVSELSVLKGVLDVFPEINLNVKAKYGNVLAQNILNVLRKCSPCDILTLLLEHGTDPNLGHMGVKHHYHKNNCNVFTYFKKLYLIDPKYVESIVPSVHVIEMERFKELPCLDEEEYQLEIGIMQSLRISQSTSVISAITLFDFMLIGANKAARYARNGVIWDIYEKNQQDFRNLVSNYGFRLNYQLRRCIIRRDKMESALDLLSLAFGINLPEHFAELIFGHFSNRALEQFSLE